MAKHAHPIEVVGYTPNALKQIIVRCAHADEERVSRKYHFEYFEEYLAHFAARGPITLVVETTYTDRDYMDDYAAYYAKCLHGKYASTCARIHLFLADFDYIGLRNAIIRVNNNHANYGDLADAYLGFITVKPLPKTFIGRTCLRTYDSNDRRYYCVTRNYDAHLLGMDLKVKSLAFQEQDTVAAACATSALWSTFHATGVLFQHQIASPVEITRIATEQMPGLRRALPNKGLNPLQMAAAIKATGLEPELVGVETKLTLQNTVYAYVRAGIPVILNCSLFDISDLENPIPQGGAWNVGHAVTVTGYSLPSNQTEGQEPCSGMLFKASHIDELYVHDDQIGPFARLRFGGPSLKILHPIYNREHAIELTMLSSWRGRSGLPDSACFAPETVILPLYHKIRIGLDSILKLVRDDFDTPFEVIRLNANNIFTGRLVWDIFLTTAKELKRDLRQLPHGLDGDKLWDVLEMPTPRFIWRATGYDAGAPVIDVLYDATDVEQGDFLMNILIYSMRLREYLDELISKSN
jgi:hypothetical protein